LLRKNRDGDERTRLLGIPEHKSGISRKSLPLASPTYRLRDENIPRGEFSLRVADSLCRVPAMRIENEGVRGSEHLPTVIPGMRRNL
jgi:hypothetical protein